VDIYSNYLYTMANKSQDESIIRVRRNLLESGYGRFDLVPELFPIAVLLNEKPRQLRRQLAQRLDLEIGDIRYKTFISWLSRFRTRHTTKGGSHASGAPGETANEQREGEEPWRKFRPSEPKRQDAQEGELLGFPKYD
jgi:hypothetical protein